MTDDTITMHVHEAAEALLKLRGEQGQITPADIAETVQQFDLDEIEAEALAAELDGLVDDDETEVELDLRADTPFTTDSLQLFLNEAGRYPLLTAAEEVELAKRIERGDMAAKERMITSNLRLVVSIAKRYQTQGIALLDEIAEGDALGLIAFRDRNHETQVRRDHPLLGGHVAALDPLRELNFLGSGQKRVATSLVQEELQRVGGERRVGAQVELDLGFVFSFDEPVEL